MIYIMREFIVRHLVFLGDIAILVEEHDAGVEVGSVGEPGAVRQEEVCRPTVGRAVENFLYVRE